jgi:two-component system chemotaxis response regulator CheY
MRILIVDDDQSERLLLRRYLERYGECDFAENGLEAIARVGQSLNEGKPYDLICLDISMPKLDGHKTLKEIRHLERLHLNGYESKIVMISAIRSVRTVMEAFGEMCDAYLTKPFEKKKLFEKIESLGFAKMEANTPRRNAANLESGIMN